MDYAMPVAWGQDSRGFWTHRKKTALGLLVLLAVLAGLATAFTLFDRTVGNNVIRNASRFDYEVWKKEAEIGDAEYRQTGAAVGAPGGGIGIFSEQDSEGAPVQMFPGDTRMVDVKIKNTNAPARRDATFYVYVDQIGIKDQNGNLVAPNDTRWAQFANLWSVKIDKGRVVTSSQTEPADKEAILNEDDHTGENLANNSGVQQVPQGNSDDSGNRQYSTACQGPVRQITRNSSCQLGTVRKSGATDAAGESTDERYYRFNLTQVDSGTDQSAFKGWLISFTLVFQAQVPALPDPDLADDTSR